MEVGSAIELYTTLLGWVLYDKMWGALAETGVAYLPFLALVVGNFAKAWEKNGMEGVSASIRGMEIQLASMLTVAALAGSPVVSLQSADLAYTAPCGGATVSGGNSGTGYDKSFQLGNSQAMVPVWWRAVMAVSAGFSNAAIAATPCQGDLRRMNYRMENTVIKDLDLKAQLDDFYQDCFLRARSQFIRQGQSLPPGRHRLAGFSVFPGHRRVLQQRQHQPVDALAPGNPQLPLRPGAGRGIRQQFAIRLGQAHLLRVVGQRIRRPSATAGAANRLGVVGFDCN